MSDNPFSTTHFTQTCCAFDNKSFRSSVKQGLHDGDVVRCEDERVYVFGKGKLYQVDAAMTVRGINTRNDIEAWSNSESCYSYDNIDTWNCNVKTGVECTEFEKSTTKLTSNDYNNATIVSQVYGGTFN